MNMKIYNSTWMLLNKEFMGLCYSSEKFRQDRNVTVEDILIRYKSHDNPGIALDIARDCLFFNDKDYKVITQYERKN